MDNYYYKCPPREERGGFLRNDHTATSINEFIKYKNGIVRDDDYRLFLQMNATKLMDAEWLSLRKNNSCWQNACVHTYPLRMDPRLFAQEREKANLLFRIDEIPDELKCVQYSDYRLTETPMQKMKISPTCGNGSCPFKQ